MPGGVVLDRVVDLARTCSTLLHRDQAGAHVASTVVRAVILIERQAPLDQAAAVVTGVVDDVAEIFVVLVADPRAARVLGAELPNVGEVVVDGGPGVRFAPVPVPRDPAEQRVGAYTGVLQQVLAQGPVVAVVEVLDHHLGRETSRTQRRIHVVLGEVDQLLRRPGHARIVHRGRVVGLAAVRLVLHGDVVDPDPRSRVGLDVLHQILGIQCVVLGLQGTHLVHPPVGFHPARRAPGHALHPQLRVQLLRLLGQQTHVGVVAVGVEVGQVAARVIQRHHARPGQVGRTDRVPEERQADAVRGAEQLGHRGVADRRAHDATAQQVGGGIGDRCPTTLERLIPDRVVDRDGLVGVRAAGCERDRRLLLQATGDRAARRIRRRREIDVDRLVRCIGERRHGHGEACGGGDT